MANDHDRLIDATAVCERLDVSIATLHRMRKRGFPQPLRLGPQTVRWRSDEVDAFIKEASAKRDGQRSADNRAPQPDAA